jgi:2-phospho-L-lactate guanylyltransferase (CobY/MobA/RfbA family)
MPTVIVPFRGENAKQRLAPLPEAARAALAKAMLADVLAACESVGRTLVAREGGQGEAVEAALRGVEPGPILIVNADLPCARPRDLLALLGAMPERGLAIVEAADGTTNALALSSTHLFAPVYGPGSAKRFRARAERLGVGFVSAEVPELADDVDTLADLERLEGRLGPNTAAALDGLRALS